MTSGHRRTETTASARAGGLRGGPQAAPSPRFQPGEDQRGDRAHPPAPRRKRRALATAALALTLVACGRATPTATPPPTPTATPTATPTPAPTATRPASPGIPPPIGGATPGGTPTGGTPVANPAAVSSAYANLAKLDSYHLEIVVTNISALLQFGLGDKLTYTIDANKGDQRIVIDDGSGTKQEGLRVGGKFYTVEGGKATEAPSLPLIFTLPDLLYSTLTAPGAMTFTAAGGEQVNGRATTRYTGTGNLTRLASNPLLAVALAGASGDLAGPVWVDTRESFLVAGEIALNVTAPRTGTTKLRMDVTQVNQVAPITLPR